MPFGYLMETLLAHVRFVFGVQAVAVWVDAEDLGGLSLVTPLELLVTILLSEAQWGETPSLSCRQSALTMPTLLLFCLDASFLCGCALCLGFPPFSALPVLPILTHPFTKKKKQNTQTLRSQRCPSWSRLMEVAEFNGAHHPGFLEFSVSVFPSSSLILSP